MSIKFSETNLMPILSNIEKLVPLVSVLIPSYNHEKYIEEAVRSVWSQTYKNIELIVIDDGSNDQSINILNRLQHDSPIAMKVVQKENEGICKTLNLGLKLSSGKYISILASDDRYLETKFDLLIPIIEASDADVSFIYSRNLNINEDGSQVGSRLTDHPESNNELFEDILLFKRFPTICSAVIKKNILVEVGGFNEKYKFEDFDLLLRLTRKHKALFCNQPTFEYRGSVVGSLGKNVSMLYKDMIASFGDNIEFSSKSNNLFWTSYAYARLYTRISESFYMIDEFKESRRWSIKSIFKNPLQFKAYRLYIPSLLGREIIRYIRTRRG